jgi:hypothetical protein
MRSLVRRLTLGAAVIMFAPATLAAQQGKASPEDAAKALKSLQDQLDLARKERLALEAKLEKELAADMAARAKRLSMGTEVDALQHLEQLLDSAQARLLVQRDRIRLLKDEAQSTDRTVLVVLVRADAFPLGEVAAVLILDGVMTRTQTYQAEQAKAIAAGAADELYRADMTPVEHKVLVQIAGKGLNVGETVTVSAAPRKVTYVEFALKGGKLVTATWTN